MLRKRAVSGWPICKKYLITNPSNQMTMFLSTNPYQSFAVHIETRFTTSFTAFCLPLMIPIREGEYKISHRENARARATELMNQSNRFTFYK